MMKIAKLRNLGPASAIMLSDVGIKSEKDLRGQDPVDVYMLLRLFGYEVNINMLWALYGAMNDLDWREIDQAVKDELKARLDEKEAV